MKNEQNIQRSNFSYVYAFHQSEINNPFSSNMERTEQKPQKLPELNVTCFICKDNRTRYLQGDYINESIKINLIK